MEILKFGLKAIILTREQKKCLQTYVLANGDFFHTFQRCT